MIQFVLLGGAGPAQAMITSYRANRALRRKQGKAFAEIKEYLKHRHPKNSSIDLKFRDVPPEKLKKALKDIEEQLKEAKKQVRKVDLIIVGILSIPFVWLIYYMVTSGISDHKIIERENQQQQQEFNTQFNFYKTEADKYLLDNAYGNAIFQYRKALSLVPNDYESKYGIVTCLVMICQNEQRMCNDAKPYLDTLIANHPTKAALYQLRADYRLLLEDTLGANEDFKTVESLTN